MPECVVCHEEVKVVGRYAEFFQLKTGWVKKSARSATNSIHRRGVKAHSKFCHVKCIERVGQQGEQEALFDG